MKYAPRYPIQVGGELRRWSNPDRTFRYGLVKMNLECEADPYPGILILTDRSYKRVWTLNIKNLRNELSAILEPLDEETIAYWRIVQDDEERDKLLADLTKNPVFDDVLG
jgi:hypothetical protein